MKKLIIFVSIWIFCPVVFAQVLTAPLEYTRVGVKWSPSPGAISHYELRAFTKTGLDQIVSVQDTCTQVLFPKSYFQDSLFVEVRAVDSLGRVSAFSVRIGCIPEVVQTDYHKDERKRIDIEDFQAFYERYKRVLGRTLCREVSKND